MSEGGATPSAAGIRRGGESIISNRNPLGISGRIYPVPVPHN